MPHRTATASPAPPRGRPDWYTIPVAIALAFVSAVLYGVSDYVGGRASRRSPATAVALVAELVVFAVCIVVVPLIESDGPTSRAIWWGLGRAPRAASVSWASTWRWRGAT
jgi:hypothetical protein